MRNLTNLWESWKFFFILKKDSEDFDFKQQQDPKENKVREYIYHIIEKVSFIH
jgi:hypothetical protein